jgi:hypothetical protein
MYKDLENTNWVVRASGYESTYFRFTNSCGKFVGLPPTQGATKLRQTTSLGRIIC